MKTRSTMVLLIFCSVLISAANGAELQPAANDVSARVFNSADIPVQPSKPGEWKSLTFDSKRWDIRSLLDKFPNGKILFSSLSPSCALGRRLLACGDGRR